MMADNACLRTSELLCASCCLIRLIMLHSCIHRNQARVTSSHQLLLRWSSAVTCSLTRRGRRIPALRVDQMTVSCGSATTAARLAQNPMPLLREQSYLLQSLHLGVAMAASAACCGSDRIPGRALSSPRLCRRIAAPRRPCNAQHQRGPNCLRNMPMEKAPTSTLSNSGRAASVG